MASNQVNDLNGPSVPGLSEYEMMDKVVMCQPGSSTSASELFAQNLSPDGVTDSGAGHQGQPTMHIAAHTTMGAEAMGKPLEHAGSGAPSMDNGQKTDPTQTNQLNGGNGHGAVQQATQSQLDDSTTAPQQPHTSNSPIPTSSSVHLSPSTISAIATTNPRMALEMIASSALASAKANSATTPKHSGYVTSFPGSSFHDSTSTTITSQAHLNPTQYSVDHSIPQRGGPKIGSTIVPTTIGMEGGDGAQIREGFTAAAGGQAKRSSFSALVSASASEEQALHRKRHNVIEQRRREKINERIQDLEALLPTAYRSSTHVKASKARMLSDTISYLKQVQDKLLEFGVLELLPEQTPQGMGDASTNGGDPTGVNSSNDGAGDMNQAPAGAEGGAPKKRGAPKRKTQPARGKKAPKEASATDSSELSSESESNTPRKKQKTPTVRTRKAAQDAPPIATTITATTAPASLAQTASDLHLAEEALASQQMDASELLQATAAHTDSLPLQQTTHIPTDQTLQHAPPLDTTTEIITADTTTLPAEMLDTKAVEMNTTNGVFACEHCGAEFADPANLHEHSRTHTGEKPYVCLINGCNMEFATASQLYTHRAKHT